MKKSNFLRALQILFCFLLFSSLTSCEPEQTHISDVDLLRLDAKANLPASEKANYFYGATQRMGNGLIRSVISLDHNDQLTGIGVVFTERALENLGTEDTNLTLKLHPKAEGMIVDHIDVGYHPDGHLGPGFGVEHFDFHFYWITQEEKLNIPFLAGVDDLPPASSWPAGYDFDLVTVPEMGRHWVTEEQNASDFFDQTFIYGSYNSEFTFYEPMITMEYLLAGDFESSYPITPLGEYQNAGYYADAFEIHHDPIKKQYSIMLTDMSWKE